LPAAGSHHGSATARRFAPSLRPRRVIFRGTRSCSLVRGCFSAGADTHPAGKLQISTSNAGDLDADLSPPACGVLSADCILAKHNKQHAVERKIRRSLPAINFWSREGEVFPLNTVKLTSLFVGGIRDSASPCSARAMRGENANEQTVSRTLRNERCLARMPSLEACTIDTQFHTCLVGFSCSGRRFG
jgi:hypothetical protein